MSIKIDRKKKEDKRKVNKKMKGDKG